MKRHFAILALAAAVAACDSNRVATGPQASRQDAADFAVDNNPNAVYTITNQVSSNAVAVFTRAADGTLTAAVVTRRAARGQAPASARRGR